MRGERSQQRQVRGQAQHHDVVERGAQAGDRPRAGLAVDAELGQQTVVPGAHGVTAVDSRIDPHTRPSRPAHREHAARGRQEAALGVLGVDARLDCVPAQQHVALLQLERQPGGDLELAAHDVDARDELGHRVLDLDARVHLEEVPAAVRCEQELRRAGTDVADRVGEAERGCAELAAKLAADARRGRLLDHLLVAPLHRAIALAQVQAGAVRVAQDLHLDVAGALDVALVEQAAVAEGRRRLAPRRLHGGRQLGCLVHDAHPAPATAGARLDEQRVADVVRVAAAGHDGHAGALRELARGVLAPERGERVRRRSDEREAGRAAGLRELGRFREEAVAGVERRPRRPRPR